jgi:site-specific DNA-methyltransferase (adenine-specific)
MMGIQTNRVIVGDAIEVLRSLPDGYADAIITDPPYGTTRAKWDTVPNLQELWSEYERLIRSGGAIVMTASQPFTSQLVSSNYKAFRHEWIWEKDSGSNFLNANREPLKSHESVLVFGFSRVNYFPIMRHGYKPYAHIASSKTELYGHYDDVLSVSHGERYPRSVLRFSSDRGLHPTQKPVALMEYLIRTYTKPGELIIDPFCGSGTTLVAARNLGRHYIGCDLSPEYVAIAEKRLSMPYTPQLFTE